MYRPNVRQASDRARVYVSASVSEKAHISFYLSLILLKLMPITFNWSLLADLLYIYLGLFHKNVCNLYGLCVWRHCFENICDSESIVEAAYTVPLKFLIFTGLNMKIYFVSIHWYFCGICQFLVWKFAQTHQHCNYIYPYKSITLNTTETNGNDAASKY